MITFDLDNLERAMFTTKHILLSKQKTREINDELQRLRSVLNFFQFQKKYESNTSDNSPETKKRINDLLQIMRKMALPVEVARFDQKVQDLIGTSDQRAELADRSGHERGASNDPQSHGI